MSIAERALCPVLVGRDDELEALEDALLAACRGEGGVVALAGDAGVGKTRLLTELAARAEKFGATVMIGGCSEAELALPYLPFLESIGNWLLTSDIAGVRARLGATAREAAQLFPQLWDEPQPPDPGDPAQARLRLYEAVLALVRLAAEDHGLLLVLEDLHWADAASRELLDYMTRRLRGAAALVVATYRRDEMHRKHPLLPIVQGWRRSGAATVIELSPLGADDVAAMFGAIFSGEVVGPEFRDFLHERTEGNPFVVEEMLKDALDRGDIFRTQGGWDRKALSELGIPRSVSDSILPRVERLDPEHADVLQAAAVIGAAFAYPLLVAVTGISQPTVLDALQACVRQQLIVEDSSSAGRYRFRHALTREAVYEDLILPRRQELHHRVAQALSSMPDARPAELAHHLFSAGRYEEAVPVCLAAAGEAARTVAHREAADLYERALPHIRDDRLRGDVLCRLGTVQAFAADVETARRYLEEGIAILDAAADGRTAALHHLSLGRVHWIARRPELARAEYERARADLEDAGPSAELATAYIRLSGLHAFNVESEQAYELAERALAIATGAGADLQRVWATGFKGLALVNMLDEEAGFRLLDDALDEAIARGYFEVAGNTLFNTLDSRLWYGRVLECPAMLERSSELPAAPINIFATTFLKGSIDYAMGRLPAAEQAFRAALEGTRGGDWPVWHAWARQHVADGALHRLRLDDARDLLVDDRLSERQELAEGMARRLLLARAAGDEAAALAQARAAVREGDWVANLLFVLRPAVEALCDAGDVAGARELLVKTQLTERNAAYPWVLAARGYLALAEGDAAGAVDLLTRSARGIGDRGYRLDELWTRLALARALDAAGDGDGAARELSSVVAGAAEAGSALIERDARATAVKIGIELAESAAGDVAAGAPPAEAVAAGERLVTVMFADVRGYTAMTRREAPAEMAERMAAFYRWTRKEIERNKGLVDGYAGDAVMASFNVSEPSLDHCGAAVTAAIAIRDRASRTGLPVGIGVAVGAAIVGTLTGGGDVNVIGETTNLAARLQARAEPGEILLTEEAHRRVRTMLDAAGLRAEKRSLELKGFDAPVPILVIPAP